MARWSIGLSRDEGTPAMAIASKSLSPAARTVLHRGAAEPLLALVRRHLAGLAQTRHATAAELGATPTGAVGAAARRSSSAADAAAASVTIPGPLFARTFKDVEIVPKPPRRALAIPIHKWAYGVSPRDWESRRSGHGRLVPLMFGEASTGLLAVRSEKAGKLTAMYVLVGRVRQSQDRSLLPSDGELGAAARDGVLAVIDAAMRRAKGGAA